MVRACNFAKCLVILKILPAANFLNNLLHLKCVAVLPCNFSFTTIHLSDYRLFSDIGITQGSAATFIMRCEILIDDLITNLLASLSVKEF